MGCCLSTTDRGDSQSRNNLANGNDNSGELVAPGVFAGHVDGILPPGGSLDGNRGPSHRPNLHPGHSALYNRRSSVRYPAMAEQLREEGLRLEERVTRPLVRHTWTSRRPVTRAQLLRMREEYYDTRVTGRPEVWAALRLAIETMETDLATAQEIINASGITIPTGNLVNGVYDELGTRYELPDYCVAEPRNLIIGSPDVDKQELGGVEPDDMEGIDDPEEAERRRDEKGKKVVSADEDQYTVVARLSDRGGPAADIVVRFSSSETVRSIVRKIMEKGMLNSSDHIIRVAYLGKILRESEPLKDQGWQTGDVINALVLQRH